MLFFLYLNMLSHQEVVRGLNLVPAPAAKPWFGGNLAKRPRNLAPPGVRSPPEPGSAAAYTVQPGGWMKLLHVPGRIEGWILPPLEHDEAPVNPLLNFLLTLYTLLLPEDFVVSPVRWRSVLVKHRLVKRHSPLLAACGNSFLLGFFGSMQRRQKSCPRVAVNTM